MFVRQCGQYLAHSGPILLPLVILERYYNVSVMGASPSWDDELNTTPKT